MNLKRALALCLALLAWATAFPPYTQAQTTHKSVAKVRPPAVKAEPESYYAMYLQKSKIGYMIIKRSEAVTYNNKPAQKQESNSVMDLQILGAASHTETQSTSWTDPKTGLPVALEDTTVAAGRRTHVTATFTPNSVTYNADIQGSTQTRTLTLKPGEHFILDVQDAPNMKPRVGMKLSGKIFISETLSLADTDIAVVSHEPVLVNGQSVVAYKVVQNSSIGSATAWLNDEGELLRMDAPLGMQIRKVSRTVALAAPGADAPGVDLAVLVGIRPTGLPLLQPRALQTVRYSITGFTHPLAATDNIQKVSYTTDKRGRAALVTVTTRPLPDAANVSLFGNPANAPENLRPFLRSTLYVQSEDAEFIAEARRVVGDEKDAAKAAALLADYVHQSIKPDPSISALRTAKDIRQDPRGVCRDYTTLFTTLARSVGLPTKQCVGIAYAGGIFMYHAWPEVWVGNDTWVALEPTWGKPYADATHIKLAEGEITDLFNVSGDIGNYKIRVLDAK